jgi:two-component system response regulator LytT
LERQIKALIIDDEPYSRDELSHLLRAYPMIKVIGEAENGKEGLEKALLHEPDVIFVDNEMGEMSGLDVVERLQRLKDPPRIVFATAFPDFAAKAFRVGALDYLLKPFSEDELSETMARITRYFESKINVEKTATSAKLAVESEGSIFYISPEHIQYCSRVERETYIYTERETFKTKAPLKEIEDKLSSYPFFRTHKSFLVNLDQIEKLIPWCNGAYQVKVIGRIDQVQVSRNYVRELRDKLEL